MDRTVPVIPPARCRDFARLSREVEGFTSAFQLHALNDYARRQKRQGNVLEIGSFCGRSTIALAWAVIDRNMGEKVFAVDPFTDAGGAPYEVGMRADATTEGRFRDNLALWGVEKHVVVIPRRSDLAREAGLPPCRFAFIDGDHSYEAAKHDIEWALDRGASVLFLDDYLTKGDKGYPWGVKRAAQDCGLAVGMEGHDLATDNPRYEHSLVSFDLDGSCH